MAPIGSCPASRRQARRTARRKLGETRFRPAPVAAQRFSNARGIDHDGQTPPLHARAKTAFVSRQAAGPQAGCAYVRENNHHEIDENAARRHRARRAYGRQRLCQAAGLLLGRVAGRLRSGLWTAGTTFDASSRAVYSRLVDFELGGTAIEPAPRRELGHFGGRHRDHLPPPPGREVADHRLLHPDPRLQRR